MGDFLIFAICFLVSVFVLEANQNKWKRSFFKSIFSKHSLFVRIVVCVFFIILLTGYTSYIHEEEPSLAFSELAKIFTGGLVVIGLFYSILAYEFNVRKSKEEKRIQRGSATFTILKTWYESPIVDYAKEINDFEKTNEYPLVKNDINKFMELFDKHEGNMVQLRTAIHGIFNYFEIICTGINEGLIDETFVMRYFEDVLTVYYDDFIVFINKRREKYPGLFCEFTNFVEKLRNS